MAKNNGGRRKRSLGDIIADLIIIGVIAIFLFFIGSLLVNKNKEAQQSKAEASPAGTMAAASVTEIPSQKGVTKYVCGISKDGKSNSTQFVLSFSKKLKSYTETVNAGEVSTGLDAGTYKEGKKQIVLHSLQKKGSSSTYIKDGNFLLAKKDMYKGKIPADAGKTFDGTFTYTVKGQSKTTITFSKDGKYTSAVKSFSSIDKSSADQTGGKGSVTETTGTYEKNGNFISRTSDKNEPLLDFYIYKNKISNAYYEKQ